VERAGRLVRHLPVDDLAARVGGGLEALYHDLHRARLAGEPDLDRALWIALQGERARLEALGRDPHGPRPLTRQLDLQVSAGVGLAGVDGAGVGGRVPDGGAGDRVAALPGADLDVDRLRTGSQREPRDHRCVSGATAT